MALSSGGGFGMMAQAISKDPKDPQEALDKEMSDPAYLGIGGMTGGGASGQLVHAFATNPQNPQQALNDEMTDPAYFGLGSGLMSGPAEINLISPGSEPLNGKSRLTQNPWSLR